MADARVIDLEEYRAERMGRYLGVEVHPESGDMLITQDTGDGDPQIVVVSLRLQPWLAAQIIARGFGR